jgi:diguanylate cyclase (GGDEF)-like protein
VLALRDVTAERTWREQIEHRAMHDELTGLANRRLLQERIQHAIARARSRGTPFALVAIDLDRFKHVNDTLGHGAGDELLKIVGERLVNSVRQSETVARIGGDEFVLLLESVNTKTQVTRIMNRLTARVEAPIEVAGTITSVGCSFGISWYPLDGIDSAPLLQQADRAMYAEKGSKREHDEAIGNATKISREPSHRSERRRVSSARPRMLRLARASAI